MSCATPTQESGVRSQESGARSQESEVIPHPTPYTLTPHTPSP
ncbi:MAG TPA: hypothetical protein V6C78_23295 [Crinalium sp.]